MSASDLLRVIFFISKFLLFFYVVENSDNNNWILDKFSDNNDLSNTRYLISDEKYKINDFLEKH